MAIPDLQGALWAWVQGLPPWQSDLLRRLTVLDDVTDEVLTDATRMVLAAFGADVPDAVAPVPVPALAQPVAHQSVRILTLKDLISVGSIEVGQRLEFAADGLTIIYGDTGSGKSSYARVLRKACRSSAKPVEILPNVLRASPDPGKDRAGSAQIEVSIDGTSSLILRDVNAAPEPALAEVSVFDSDCASVYADGESEITYTPSSLRLFERLVSFQTQIRKRIEDEGHALNAAGPRLDGFDPSTKAGALVNALSENVNPETVIALARVDDAELAKLDAARAALAAAKAQDPARAAVNLEKRAAALDDLASALDGYRSRVEDSVVSRLLTINKRLAELAAASAALSTALSKTTALNIGGHAWNALWRAAHAYIVSLPETPDFPPSTGAADAHCPLCQQVLTEDSIERLGKFEEFFRGEVEKEIEQLLGERTQLSDAIARVPSDVRASTVHAAALLGDEVLIEKAVDAFSRSIATRAQEIHASATSRQISAPALASEPLTAIRQLSATLRKQAAEQRSLSNPEALARTAREVAEIENRLLLGKYKDAVVQRIADLKKAGKLRAAYSALATTGLSRKIGEFTEAAVTEQLRQRLASELKALGGEHLPIVVGARGAKGKTKVSLQLQATRSVDVGEVLSEGERRAVALAFFLAEVSVAESGGGIVLDDPVSSLDHTRRSYVARRLVEEAARRQVIVFTHDVVFLLELQDQARTAGRPVEVRVVRRVGNAAGITSKELPWVAQNMKARIGYLKAEMQRLGAVERKGDADAYRREAKVWFELLREAWERAVEEKLFGGVVGRFQPGIETLRLKSVSVTPAMTAAVEQGMTRASLWTHDQAPALGKPPPTAADLSAALAELETFVDQFKR